MNGESLGRVPPSTFFFLDSPQIIKMDHVSSQAQPLGLAYLFLEEKGARADVQHAGPSAASSSPPSLITLPCSRGSVGGGGCGAAWVTEAGHKMDSVLQLSLRGLEFKGLSVPRGHDTQVSELMAEVGSEP